MHLDDIVAILKALERHNVDYAIIGAMALAAHGLDRATRDLDLFVDPDSQNVARLRQALMEWRKTRSAVAIGTTLLGLVRRLIWRAKCRSKSFAVSRTCQRHLV